MPVARATDKDFVDVFEAHGPAGTARILGMAVRAVYLRRERLERKLRRPIKGPSTHNTTRDGLSAHSARHHITVKDGIVLIGSDAHYWPGHVTTAHRALVHFVKREQPAAVIMNGDALDGARISRHAPIGWEGRPSLINELEATKERLDEIRKAWKGAKFIWPLGNHDGRFETRLATVAPEYADVHGVHLKDHIPDWVPCWSCWINEDVVIKHRWKGGVHATHNNTVYAGKSMFTGHDHMLKVTPFHDYNGTRWGGSSGTLADPYGPQFVDYTEDSPKNWAAGFLRLTFRKGKLMWPEVVRVIDKDHVDFRGEIIRV